ncbi:MAG: hypothetical protein HDQ97_11130 [Lachnospiraceae bacterium]|nr:hypothetical protein [Lachnospiraceae bacterium]
MEYFALKTQGGNPIPQISSWYGKLDERKLNREHYRELPQNFLLDMKTGTDILYPDILTTPFFLVSREVMNVLRMYDEDMPFLYVILFDIDKGEDAFYFLPILAEGNDDCREAIYRTKSKNQWEIRIRLDLAESLLARGAEGMELRKIV